MDNLMEGFLESLVNVDQMSCERILEQTIDIHGTSGAVDTLLTPALEMLGKGWETGEYSLSQIYMSGRMCEVAVERIMPLHNTDPSYSLPVVAIAAMDYHLLGKRIVCSVMKSAGIHLKDYGHISDSSELLKTVRSDGVKILLLSSLMLHAALGVAEIVDGLRDMNVKVVVGGAPFRMDRTLWKEVGADAVGFTASDGIYIVKDMMGGIC